MTQDVDDKKSKQKPPNPADQPTLEHAQGPATAKDKRHAYQVIGTLIALVALAAVARYLAVPATYGDLGPYRAAALPKAREGTPQHLGQEACASCHAREVKLHAKDAHAHVQCEACHGPAAGHVRDGKKARAMTTPKGKAPCLACHRKITGRPGSFPQIDWKQHFAFVGVKEEKTPCTTCHDPHEPLFMDRDLRSARLHPVVHRCRDCHSGAERDAKAVKPAGHPAIFECSYCHKQTAEDFAKRTHRKVRCTTCHIFFRESAFAGRIIRDADPRFCLLCHGAGAFRSKTAPPSIRWPTHRDDMASDDADKKKVCIDCHRQNIHQPKGSAHAAQAK